MAEQRGVAGARVHLHLDAAVVAREAQDRDGGGEAGATDHHVAVSVVDPELPAAVVRARLGEAGAGGCGGCVRHRGGAAPRAGKQTQLELGAVDAGERLREREAGREQRSVGVGLRLGGHLEVGGTLAAEHQRTLAAHREPQVLAVKDPRVYSARGVGPASEDRHQPFSHGAATGK